METVVVWFRRDLRLADHPALVAAARGGRRVIPLFVVDPVLWDRSGAPRARFLVGCLAALHRATGHHLVVRRGRPADIVTAVAAEVGAVEVHCTEDFGPYGRRRDAAVADALAARGVALVLSGSPYAVDPGTVRTRQGTPYKVFTPFFRSWSTVPAAPARRTPPEVRWDGAEGDGLPSAPQDDGVLLPPPGEDAGLDRLEAFLDGDAERYDAGRNEPASDSTSRLSPYLRWGCVHPRTVLHRLGPSKAHGVFRSELAWREFYADVLFHRPGTAWQPMQPVAGAIRVDQGAQADERFTAWARGRTGFPLVDAGMRQLLAEGWMHNRVRMVVASFLVKDLHLPWQRGAAHFMEHLVDGDLASNNHNWQWVAGTGTDAAPYHRIFNPLEQSRRWDGEGDYIRRYVPELAGVPARDLHRQDALAHPPLGYVAPIVDHAAERAEALTRLAEAGERGPADPG